jgi:glycosyltransferase involved in cell wall biosynthesis
MIKVSVLITTYNDPYRLEKTLAHYLIQKPQPFEILICDDGSKVETKNLVDSFIKKSRTPMIHVYQEDHGWDVSGIRNLGTIQSSGDYVIITDGDCVPHPRFIHDHMQAAEPGYFVFGPRAHVLKEHIDGFSTRPDVRFKYILGKKMANRRSAIRNPFEKPEIRERASFSAIEPLASLCIGCNFAIWKHDLVAVNGFEESFQAWGPEDAECAARLLNKGLKLKKYQQKCVVYHLNHGENSKPCPEKYQFCENSLFSGKIETANGIKQHLTGAKA